MEALQDIVSISTYFAILITLVMGFLVGKLRLGRFRLGSIVGTLLVGMLIGLLGGEVTPSIRWVFFGIFMYLVGYQGGYRLINTLKLRRRSILVASMSMSLIAILTLAFASWLFDLNLFMAIGMTAGSFVHPEILSEASEVIGQLPGLTETAKQLAQHQVHLGYMTTVIFGVLVPVLMITWLLPAVTTRLLGDTTTHHVVDTYSNIVRRVFQVNADSTVVGKTLAQLNEPSIDTLFALSRATSGAKPAEDAPIVAGDVLTITGCHNALFYFDDNLLGTELPSDLEPDRSEENHLILIHGQLVGQSLHQIKTAINQGGLRAVCITAMFRDDQALEITPELVVNRDDILQITGCSDDIQAIKQDVGQALPHQGGNQALFGLGLVVAYLISLWHLDIGGLYLYFSMGLSSLVSGIAVGWACHRVNPLELLPANTSSYLRNLSLLAFTAVTGIYFGPHMIDAIQANGVKASLIGFCVVLISQLLSFLLAFRIFKVRQPAELMGWKGGRQPMGHEMSAGYRQRDTFYALTISYLTSSVLMMIVVSAALRLL
ncbi:hypothetical protein [Shewanella colwelliana]|uniref:aspartate-alanine antiporter-like transporter n=1 Tax=Shewanella colwelliana TaxID=23 RepID=UPI00048A480C|nr:hypothetical protein [Shewanella colwelliana]